MSVSRSVRGSTAEPGRESRAAGGVEKLAWPSNIEIWGGFECTVARIGDGYRDQLEETGHARRIEDLDRVAALGIRRLRYPVLFERISPDRPDAADWRWTDERLAHLERLKIGVIAGLVHHGSGPRYTSLVDPVFPELLAGHAEAAARRYPHVRDWTPVNEPLTTARFSGLYGHWFPHGREEATFLGALFNQCRGVALAMAAVRRVRSDARLVQTEDLGRIFATPGLEYQARYENERRWLSFDLLTGRVTRDHPFFERFLAAGIASRDLLALADAPCPPDVVGINHYLTSDRFLDDRLDGYPAAAIGGNGIHRYADIAAVRAHLPPDELGIAARLAEASERYRLPVAVTEVHNGSTREEQLRWLAEAAGGVQRLAAAGVDVRAICVWALAGAVDWNSLLTERRGFYEPGVLDARGDPPRETALGRAVRRLAAGRRIEGAVMAGRGWWHRADRFHRPAPTGGEAVQSMVAPALRTAAARRLLVTGGSGTLGRAFARIAARRGLEHVLVTRADMDIADPASVGAALAHIEPWAIVNTAGYVRVAEAEREPGRCHRENALGAAVLAEAARTRGIPLVTFSSDLVFDGRAGRPYVESDAPSPACVYGASKAEAERRVGDAHPGALVVRTAAFFGPWDVYNFAHLALAALGRGERFTADAGTAVSPTYVPDLVDATLDLLIDGADGIWHVASDGLLTWHEFARRLAQVAGLDAGRIEARPVTTSLVTGLASEKGVRLPPVEEAIARFVGAREA